MSRSRLVLMLNPGTTYFWKATWGGGFRLQVLEGGLKGQSIYNLGKTVSADYGANPQHAYLGRAPGGAASTRRPFPAPSTATSGWGIGRVQRPSSPLC